ncbi:dnaJ homolog subfamily C member 27 [Lepeophtheirus salmonis]|uniref:dnaJ homolog subfamily C member 27 n=1 Tax=Lepeophtheirus salmonis TaxID=72036 RepID=UPI001AE2AE9C|nr:dnaJ homolog subfamily C member 27-like [Lepeophtheirus salmonis]
MSSSTNTSSSTNSKAEAKTGSSATAKKKTSSSSYGCRPMRLRVVMTGGEKTGKSCIIKRYCEKRFVDKYVPTIGIDYGATRIYVDKKEISVHIFDTSGSNLFRDVRNEFYRDAHGILLVFDVTNRQSFDELSGYIKDVAIELAKDGRTMDNTVVLVCGNKSDLKEIRMIDETEAKLWAELRGFDYAETSALNGDGIADLFRSFFTLVLKSTESSRKTPVAMRKSVSKAPSQHRHSLPIKPSPSPDQLIVIDRLKSSIDPWCQMGLDRSTPYSPEEINKTYRKLAVLLHPDKTEVDGADEAFKILGSARKAIMRASFVKP